MLEILLKGVKLAADRRKTRYKPVENGLLDADALKVRRKVETEAVDPALGDELAARLARRGRSATAEADGTYNGAAIALRGGSLNAPWSRLARIFFPEVVFDRIHCSSGTSVICAASETDARV